MVRTTKQNRALHKYFELLADCLNDAGLDMKVVLKPSIQIDWTKDRVKEYLWRPIQEAYINETSTTKLETKDLNKIWLFLDRHLKEKFGKFAELPDFPSIELNMIEYENNKSKNNIQ